MMRCGRFRRPFKYFTLMSLRISIRGNPEKNSYDVIKQISKSTVIARNEAIPTCVGGDLASPLSISGIASFLAMTGG
jgi:hypothetical protein